MRPVRVYATSLVPWAQVLSRTLVTDHTAEPRSRLSHSCSLSPAAGATSTLDRSCGGRSDFTGGLHGGAGPAQEEEEEAIRAAGWPATAAAERTHHGRHRTRAVTSPDEYLPLAPSTGVESDQSLNPWTPTLSLLCLRMSRSQTLGSKLFTNDLVPIDEPET